MPSCCSSKKRCPSSSNRRPASLRSDGPPRDRGQVRRARHSPSSQRRAIAAFRGRSCDCQRLERLNCRGRGIARSRTQDRSARSLAAVIPTENSIRSPFFCSGCPHNSSTKRRKRAIRSADGCHSMAMYTQPRVLATTQMGGEGASWIGLAPFRPSNMCFRIWETALTTIQDSWRSAPRWPRRSTSRSDSVQRRGRDDRRPAHRRPFDGGRVTKQSWPKVPCAVSSVTDTPEAFTDASTLANASSPCIATRSSRFSSPCAASPESRSLSTRKPARRRSGAGASAKRLPIREAHVHQLGGMRRVRGLFGSIALREYCAARNRTRPQTADRSVDVQQGLQLRQRILPFLRHHHGGDLKRPPPDGPRTGATALPRSSGHRNWT